MPSHHLTRLAAATSLATLLAIAAGCSGQSEQQLTQSAREYLDKKDLPAAVIQLKAALQKNPQSGELRFLMGDTLLKQGEYGPAALELGKAADLKYDDNKVVPSLAKALVAGGQSKRATELYGSMPLTDPRAAAELKVAMAAGYSALGQREASDAAVRAALQLDPKNFAARLLEARATANRGDYDKALSQAEALIAEDPAERQALQLKGDILWMGKGDREKAVAAYRRVLEVDPRYLPAHSALLAIYVQQKDPTALRQGFAALKKALPNHAETRFYEAQLALVDRDIPRARELTQQLLRGGPDNPRLLQLAGAVEATGGSVVLAETHLNKALQYAPNLPFARRLLAETYLRIGQPERTLATLKPLLEQARPPADALAMAAEAHLQAGEPALAEQFYTQAAKADPSDVKVRTALALTEIAKGRADAGFTQLEGIAARDASMYADLALIGARMRRSDFQAALADVTRLQAKAPDKAAPLHLRGRILMGLNDPAGARAAFEKALSLDPQYMPAIANLAALDVADRKPELAIKRYEELVQREPKNAGAMVALAELRRTNGAPPADVTKLLQDAIRINPGDPMPRTVLVNHLLALRDTSGAVTAAQQAVAASPDDPRALLALGRAQVLTNDLQQAISTYGRMAAAQPADPRPLLLLADAYERAGDKTNAERTLRKTLDVRNDVLEAQDKLVQLRIADRRYDAALDMARVAQKQRPQQAFGFLLESNVHAAQRNWEPALAAARAALDRQATSDVASRLHALNVMAGRQADADRFASEWGRAHPRDGVFLTYLGSAAIGQRDWARAETLYRSALELRPGDASAANNIAWLLLQQNKPGALKFAERANELAPGRPTTMDTLASALAAENQLPQALEWQRKAVEAAPDAPTFRLNLAKLLIKSGDKEGAKTELGKLTRQGSRFAGQEEAVALLKSLS